MDNEIANKIASVAKQLSAEPRKKTTAKEAVLSEMRKQKSEFKKALKNGYTRKEIIEKLNEDGIKITSREFASIIGTRKKGAPKKNEASEAADTNASEAKSAVPNHPSTP